MSSVSNPYIYMRDSATSGSGYRFRVIQQGFKRILNKESNLKKGIGGGLDLSVGSVYEMFEYVVRVREEEPEGSLYGTKGELERLWRLNNPNGTPSNVISIYDHLLQPHTCYLLGDFNENLLSVMITGQEAWSLINVSLIYVS